MKSSCYSHSYRPLLPHSFYYCRICRLLWFWHVFFNVKHSNHSCKRYSCGVRKIAHDHVCPIVVVTEWNCVHSGVQFTTGEDIRVICNKWSVRVQSRPLCFFFAFVVGVYHRPTFSIVWPK